MLTEHVSNAADGWLRYQSRLGSLGFDGPNALQYAERVVTSQASTMAVNDVFFGLGCVFILLVPFVWLARPPFGARAR